MRQRRIGLGRRAAYIHHENRISALNTTIAGRTSRFRTGRPRVLIRQERGNQIGRGSAHAIKQSERSIAMPK